MNFISACLFIVVGFTCLIKGADVFVDNASGIATKFKVSPLVIGLTIVAFGTSLPELAVSVTAAIDGANEIAVGNVVGSNLFNTLVVAGMSACFFPLATSKTLMKRDWPISIIASIVLLVFLFDCTISRIEASLLCAGLVLTLLSQLKEGKVEEANTSNEDRKLIVLVLFLILGVAGIVVGGQLTVKGAVSLARILGWSETLIGLTVIAIGTSLPELVTSVVAARKGQTDIAMGNVIGSNLFNILCILGISGVIHPITVASSAIIDVAVLCVVSFVFWLLCRKFELNRKMGLLQISTYAVYMAYIILR